MQLSQIFLPTVDHHLLVRRRFVAQFSVVTGNAELLDQAKRGKQFRFAENGFGENFLVEKIEAPGPEPNQVDQENRERDDREQDDAAKPLQNAFKHAIDMEPLNLRRVKSISLAGISPPLPQGED